MSDDVLGIRVHARRDPRGWLIVPLYVGPLWKVNFVLHTGHLRSSINRATYAALSGLDLLRPITNRSAMIEQLSAEGQPLPNLNVRLGLAATTLGIEGILGLDFLEQFEEVRFNFAALELTLL